MLHTPEKGRGSSNQQQSVLDELENYWQEYDASSAHSEQFGIMKRQAQDMMLLNSSDKKRSGAFCIGI